MSPSLQHCTCRSPPPKGGTAFKAPARRCLFLRVGLRMLSTYRVPKRTTPLARKEPSAYYQIRPAVAPAASPFTGQNRGRRATLARLAPAAAFASPPVPTVPAPAGRQNAAAGSSAAFAGETGNIPAAAAAAAAVQAVTVPRSAVLSRAV